MTDTLRDAIAAMQADDAPTERECGYQDAIDEVLRILDARAALAAAPQPDPERETCDVCCGTGIDGHPDSGYTCHRCEGQGGIEPQPAPVDREALVEAIADRATLAREIAKAMIGRAPGNGMILAIADALLARGLRLPGAEDHLLDHIRALVKEADEKGLWRTETIQMPKRVVEGGDDAA